MKEPSVIVKIFGKDAGLDQIISKANTKLSRFSGMASRMGHTALKIGVPFGIAAGYMIHAAANFQESMTNVKLASGASADEMGKLNRAALDVGRGHIGPTETAEGMEQMAKAGWDVNKMLGGLNPMSDLAEVTHKKLGETVGVVAGIMDGYKIPMQELPGLTDMLAYATKKSRVTLEGLGEGMKEAIPLSNQWHVSTADLVSTMAILSRKNIQGGEGVMALRKAMIVLQNPTSKAAEALQRLGIKKRDILDSHNKIRSLGEVLDVFQKRGAKASDIAEIFGKKAGGPTMVALLEGGKNKIAEFSAAMQANKGYAASTAKTIGEDLNQSVARLRANLERLAVGSEKKGGLVTNLADISDSVGRVMNKMQAANPTMVRWAEGLGIAAIAAGPVIGGVGKITGAMRVLMTTLDAMRIFALANPWTLAILGIGAAAYGGYNIYQQKKKEMAYGEARSATKEALTKQLGRAPTQEEMTQSLFGKVSTGEQEIHLQVDFANTPQGTKVKTKSPDGIALDWNASYQGMALAGAH